MTDKATDVLVVEDTMTQALILQHLLESHQFKVFVARSGSKALEYLKTNSPDIILSDVNMPEMDGYELCRIVKSDPGMKEIPFVLLSSFGEAKDLVSILACRADNFLLKRFDSTYLVTRVNDILATSRLRKSDPTAIGNTAVLGGAQHIIEGSSMQMLDMVLSAFTTVTHLLPLLREE